jgi:hypothetical protein
MSYSYRGVFDPTGSSASRMRGSESFPSPFLDMASMAMPDGNKNALEWCEHIFMANETLRMALERIIAYFLTDIQIGALSPSKPLGDDEKEKWHSFLHDKLRILLQVAAMDRDLMCYGNSFISVMVPFRKMLTCSRCKEVTMTLKEIYENPQFRFKFAQTEFHAKCPKCSYEGSWICNDMPDNTPDRITLKRWPVHEIQLLHNEITDEVQYFWDIPDTYKKELQNNKPPLFHLERTSQGMLKAIKHNKLFKFAPGTIYHMKEPALCGLRNRGWGVSRLITSFRQVWYVQVLRRYNEAIALDYVIPFRLITPTDKGGQTAHSRDMLLSANAGDFMSQVRTMVRKRRQNPAAWFTLPFPVQYQMLGADATQLAPTELLNQGFETLLNGLGTPVEMYKGTLQLQTAPVSMRLFEATWYHLVYNNNDFLRWLVERLARILMWEGVSAKHVRVQHADDMQRHMALLQLMMGGVVSQSTGLRALGLEYVDELRAMAEEARQQQQQQQEMQEEMDTMAFGQQMAQGAQMGTPPGPPGAQAAGGAAGGQNGGAAPPAGGGAVDPATGMPVPGPVTSMVQNNYMPQTPDEMLAQAQSLAQQLLGMPESAKDSELRMLKQKNEVLHSLVRSQLDKMRGQARSQGGAMLMSQQFGGGAGGAAPPPA